MWQAPVRGFCQGEENAVLPWAPGGCGVVGQGWGWGGMGLVVAFTPRLLILNPKIRGMQESCKFFKLAMVSSHQSLFSQDNAVQKKAELRNPLSCGLKCR